MTVAKNTERKNKCVFDVADHLRADSGDGEALTGIDDRLFFPLGTKLLGWARAKVSCAGLGACDRLLGWAAGQALLIRFF